MLAPAASRDAGWTKPEAPAADREARCALTRSSVIQPASGEGLRERLIARAASLPLGNQAALTRVTALCDDAEASAREVALAIAGDEGLAALVLRLANSAHSASRMRIADLTTAVARLGLALVQGLAVAAPGLRLLNGPSDGLQGTRRELHRHAVRTGIAARALSPSDAEAERALAAGLLHNLGLNVISLYAPAEFRVLVGAAARGESLGATEEELLGFTHAELGALVAERWSYPLPLVVAIRDHDSPTPAGSITMLVQVADRVVREAGIGVEAPAPIPASTVAALGIAPASFKLRLLPLLEMQDRIDRQLETEAAAPGPLRPPAQSFVEILDRLF